MAGSGQIVVIKRDGYDGPSYPVSQGSISIGSGKTSDFRIPVKGLAPLQCTITVNTNNALIKNLSSNTQTIINGKSIKSKTLVHGDIITFNVAQFRWDYLSQTGTIKPANMKTPKGATPKSKLSVKKTNKGITKRKSFPAAKKTETQIKKFINSRSSLDALIGKSRQVAVVKPQRREDLSAPSTPRNSVASPKAMSARSRTSTPSSAARKQQMKRFSTNLVSADMDSSLITNKRRKINDIEKVDTPVIIDKNKRAALMLLTGKSPKNRGTPTKAVLTVANASIVNAHNTPVSENAQKTPKVAPNRQQKSASPQFKISAMASQSTLYSPKRFRTEPASPHVDTPRPAPTSTQKSSKSSPAINLKSSKKVPIVNAKSASVSRLPVKNISKIAVLKTKSLSVGKEPVATRRSIGKHNITATAVKNTPASLVVKSIPKLKETVVEETPKLVGKDKLTANKQLSRSVRKTPIGNQSGANKPNAIPRRKILAINPKTFYKRNSPKKGVSSAKKTLPSNVTSQNKVETKIAKATSARKLNERSPTKDAPTPKSVLQKQTPKSSRKTVTANDKKKETPKSIVKAKTPVKLNTPKGLLTPSKPLTPKISSVLSSPKSVTQKSPNIRQRKSVLANTPQPSKPSITPIFGSVSSPKSHTPKSVKVQTPKISTPKPVKALTPKAKSPKAQTPKSPKPITPRLSKLLTPKTQTSKSPKAQTPKSPKAQTPKSPKAKTPKAQTPKSPKAKTPKAQTPKSPKATTPKAHTPKYLKAQTPKSPKAKTPKAQTPKSPKARTPKVQTPMSPKATTPKAHTPKSPKAQTPKSPKVKTPRLVIVRTSRALLTPKSPKAKTPKSAIVRISRALLTPKSPKAATLKSPKPQTPKSPKDQTPKSPKTKTPISKAQTPKSPKVQTPKSPKNQPKSPKAITSKSPKAKTPLLSKSPKQTRKSTSGSPSFVIKPKSPKMVATPKLILEDVLNSSCQKSPVGSPNRSTQSAGPVKRTSTPNKPIAKSVSLVKSASRSIKSRLSYKSVKFLESSGEFSEYESFSNEYITKTIASPIVLNKSSSRLSKKSVSKATTPSNSRLSTRRSISSSSPIVSPKPSSPRTPDSLPIPDDENINLTPNLSILFDIEASTPLQKTNSRGRRSSVRNSSVAKKSPKNTKNLIRKVKTEPRKNLSSSEKAKLRKKTRGNKSVDQLSNSSDATDENAPKPDNEIVITPKSTVKLVPELLREKHSTAKKSLSRKAMIDHLTASPEIAKELFKSPVKRKLSQSIRIYNTSIALDDVQDASIVSAARDVSFNSLTSTRRVSRSSPNKPVANTGSKTPSVSPKNRVSPRKSESKVVRGKSKSPLNTLSNKSKSPFKSSEKSKSVSLKISKSPKNDLSDVGGVKRLLKTPRAPKSPKNDLTDVRGVKKILATPRPVKSPKNDLTNVAGVKRILASPRAAKSPKNDLTDVSGVKKLLATPRPVRSPKNDLTNVQGVKNIIRTPRPAKSPKNDLTNVSGVKKLLKTPRPAKSPKNDLTNVSGVKKLLKTPRAVKSPKNDLSDVTGVKNLVSTPRPAAKSPRAAKTPKNDLTDIQGLKNMFRTPRPVKSPKNDLTNVQGVKKILSTPKAKQSKSPKNSLENISGVQELFGNKSNSENLFDSLTGKSPLKTYKNPKIVITSPTPVKRTNSSIRDKSTESNSSPSRSRRQTTIDRTNFSMEVSKVDLSSKRPPNASILGQSTPARPKKPAANVSEINIKLLSPILSVPKVKSKSKSVPATSRSSRSLKNLSAANGVVEIKKETPAKKSASQSKPAAQKKGGKRKLEEASLTQDEARVAPKKGRRTRKNVEPAEITQDSKMEKSVDKKKKVTFASDVTKVADDRPSKARTTRSRTTVFNVELTVSTKITKGAKKSATSDNAQEKKATRGKKRSASEDINTPETKKQKKETVVKVERSTRGKPNKSIEKSSPAKTKRSKKAPVIKTEVTPEKKNKAVTKATTKKSSPAKNKKVVQKVSPVKTATRATKKAPVKAAKSPSPKKAPAKKPAAAKAKGKTVAKATTKKAPAAKKAPASPKKPASQKKTTAASKPSPKKAPAAKKVATKKASPVKATKVVAKKVSKTTRTAKKK